MTMTSPRKTSTETKRGVFAESGEAFVLTMVSNEELAAVTMHHSSEQMSILQSSFYLNDVDKFVCLWNVNRLQIKIVELFT